MWRLSVSVTPVNLNQIHHTYSGPPSPPRIETQPSLDMISVGDKVLLSCLLARPGQPPAVLSWYREGHLLTSDQSHLTVTVTETSQFSCEASNEAGTVLTTVNITPIPRTTSTTTRRTTTTRQTTTTTTSTTTMTQSTRSGDIHDQPAADMPVDEYDYSHFEYLNQKFESEFKETVKFAEENYDYEEYQDEDEAEKMENSILIKRLKEEFSSSSSGTVSFPHWIIFVTFYILKSY